MFIFLNLVVGCNAVCLACMLYCLFECDDGVNRSKSASFI